MRKWLILSQWEQFSTWGDKFPTINIKVKPAYKGHSMSFMGICSLYTGYNYVHYSLVGKMRLPFMIDERKFLQTQKSSREPLFMLKQKLILMTIYGKSWITVTGILLAI
jgi:hypothetical protein